MGAITLSSIAALLKDLEEFKAQAKIHQNFIQMQVQFQNTQGIAQRLGKSNMAALLQPSKMIIEATLEESSSEESEGSNRDSIGDDELQRMF